MVGGGRGLFVLIVISRHCAKEISGLVYSNASGDAQEK